MDWAQTAIDLGLNFATTLAGNSLGSKIVPTNPGWFQPKKFLSVFTKSYYKQLLEQVCQEQLIWQEKMTGANLSLLFQCLKYYVYYFKGE